MEVGAGHDLPGIFPKSAKPGAHSRNHSKINCVKIARKRAGSRNQEQKALDHPSRTIREKFCSRAVEKRTPAENLIKFKVGEKFLKIRFREKVGGFKIVYKVF